MPLFQGLRTTPLLDIFPDSLTKLPTICLYGLGFFANIVLLYFLLKSFNLLNINNMHNFLYINLLFISFCATARCDAGCRTIYYIWRASVLRLMHGSGFQTHYIFASPRHNALPLRHLGCAGRYRHRGREYKIQGTLLGPLKKGNSLKNWAVVFFIYNRTRQRKGNDSTCCCLRWRSQSQITSIKIIKLLHEKKYHLDIQ